MAYLEYEKSYVGQLREKIGNDILIVPTVRAVIPNAQGEILFIRRSDDGSWGMPAGSIELNESISDCLQREVREETGLEVLEAQPMAIYSEPRFAFTTCFGGKHQMFSVVFIVTKWTGQLTTQTDETIDARFFSLNNLPPIPELYQETLQDYQKFYGKFILK
ncbi:MAG: NUDIX domain-containing protein [Anaerolineaceae bacterium]|nr:NUDIX domain-containing protein [Anaerolineaceae bacterium]